jgi:hypothetical protein
MTRKPFTSGDKVAIVVCVASALFIGWVLGAHGRQDSATAQAPTRATHTTPARAAAPTARPPVPVRGTLSRAEHELRADFGDRVTEVDRFAGVLTVGLKASDNLTNGMIRRGMKTDAGDALRDVYDHAGLRPTEVLVQMHMPLTDTRTGRESDGVVAVYAMRRAEARAVDWSSTAIDWDNYRTMLHQAVR